MTRLRPPGRYLRLLGIFWRNAIATELEYRLNFWSNAALSLFWLVWAGLGIGVYFQYAEDVRGWTYPEMLVVVGLFFTVNGIRQALITPNLAQMTDYVRKGTLDFLLTKPVDSQFMVSFRHLGVYNVTDPVLGLALVAGALVASGRPVTPGGVVSFAVLLAAGLVVLYALALALFSAALRAVSSDGIDELLWGLVETARLPVHLYRGVVRTALTVVLPVAFLTTVPAEALLGRGSPGILAVALGVAGVSLLLSSALWRLALRGYTGASA